MGDVETQKKPSWGGTIFLIGIAIFLMYFSVKQGFDTKEQSKEQAIEIAQKVSEEVTKTIESNRIVFSNQEVKAPNDFYGMGAIF